MTRLAGAPVSAYRFPKKAPRIKQIFASPGEAAHIPEVRQWRKQDCDHPYARCLRAGARGITAEALKLHRKGREGRKGKEKGRQK